MSKSDGFTYEDFINPQVVEQKLQGYGGATVGELLRWLGVPDNRATRARTMRELRALGWAPRKRKKDAVWFRPWPMPEPKPESIDYGGTVGRCKCTTWYVKDIPATNFYGGLEDRVRNLVYVLRQHGINTECSCHHDGYVQVAAHDMGYGFLREVYDAMYEANCLPYTVVFKRAVDKDGHLHEMCDIKSPLLRVEANKIPAWVAKGVKVRFKKGLHPKVRDFLTGGLGYEEPAVVVECCRDKRHVYLKGMTARPLEGYLKMEMFLRCFEPLV